MKQSEHEFIEVEKRVTAIKEVMAELKKQRAEMTKKYESEMLKCEDL